MSRARTALLEPSGFGRTPWKNGGGVVIDIAGESRPGAPASWDATLWRFGRTTIPAAAPFSDLAGFDRLLMVVVGHGLVLHTPTQEIDVRRPFVPVRFDGGTKVVSRLEAGPVDVVNLIADRARAAIDLATIGAGDARSLGAGSHVLYAPVGACALRCDGEPLALPAGHALRIDAEGTCDMLCAAGPLVVASVFPSSAVGRTA